MQFIWVIMLFALSCNKDSGSSAGDASGASAAGSLAIVSGELTPAEGAEASTTKGALVLASGHPEISAVTDENSKFEVKNVLPGTLEIYVASNDGLTALTEDAVIGPSEYGLKLPDVVAKGGEVTDLGSMALKKTGGFKGNVLFYSNPNNLDLTGSEVFVPGTGFIVKTDATGAFALSGLPPGKYTLRAQHTGFSVLDLVNVEVEEGEVTNLGNISLSISTGPEGSIAITGATDVTIDGESFPVVTSANREVKYTLTYDADASLMKISDEPAFINKGWVPVASSGTWTAFKTDGKKTLYVMYSDLNGLESSPNKVEFYIDTAAPTSPSIELMYGWDQISSSASYQSAVLSAQDNGTGIASMSFCETANFSGCNTWVSYATEYDQIPVAATIYVKFKDYVGNVSTAASDVIGVGAFTVMSAGEFNRDFILSKDQSPYSCSNAIEIDGNLTIEAGVTIDCTSSIKVNGRLKAVGTAIDNIIITSSTNFDGFDLSESNADDNEIRFVSVNNIVGASAFLRINGGILSDSSLKNSSLASGVVKTGFKPFTMKGNVFENLVIKLENGESNLIEDNTLIVDDSSNQSPVLDVLGGSGTQFNYNSVNVKIFSSSGNYLPGINIATGSFTMTYNDIRVEVDLNGTAGTAGGVLFDGTGRLTANHNNFDIESIGLTEEDVFSHFEVSLGSIYLDNNHFVRHGNMSDDLPRLNDGTLGTPEPNSLSNHKASPPWSIIAGIDCVGAACN